jgi:hypothetical protein
MDDGGVGGDHCNNDEKADNCEIDHDMEELLRHVEPEVLIGSAKGLENFDALKKITRVYDESKGCENTWMVLRFLIQLLMLTAKYGWLDSSFNNLLRLLGSLLPKRNFMLKNPLLYMPKRRQQADFLVLQEQHPYYFRLASSSSRLHLPPCPN